MEKITIGPRRTNLTNPISRQLYLSYAQYDDGFNVNMLIIYEALALYRFFFFPWFPSDDHTFWQLQKRYII